MDQKILDKLSAIGDQVKHVQETQTRFEKEHDGIDLQNVKENAEKAAKSLEEVQGLKQQLAAIDYKDRLDAIELAIARSGKGAEGNPEAEKTYKNAMLKYLRRGVAMDSNTVDMLCKAQAELELLGADDDKINYQAKDLVAASGPDGGYFIMPDRSNRISTRIFETSPLRPVANIVTTSSDMWEMIIDDDETSCGHVGEVEARPLTTTAQVGLIKIPVHENYAQPRATQKMLDDAGFDIEAWHQAKVTRDLGRLENTDFVLGSGSKCAKGFLTYPAWAVAGTYERDAVEQITATGTAGTLDNADDLINLQNNLIEDYQAGAAFAMRRATFSSIMQLRSTVSGDYLLDPRVLKVGGEKILLGAPVIFMSDMPAVAAAALPVIYANFREMYTIVDRLGIRVMRNPYILPPYVYFYTTKRVGGAVTNFEAGKILVINS